MELAVIGRLLELFEGPEAPGPWAPPAMPAALHALLPWRAWDESSELYVNAASTGFVLELPPFAGIDAETLGALSGTLADAAPERCTVQVLHWASPRFGAAADAWAAPRENAGGAMARMGQRRGDLLAHGGWRRLHAGGPPFTLSDYRVFLTACLAGGRDRQPIPRSARSAGPWRARWPRPARMRAGWSRMRCSRSRPSWSPRISMASVTGKRSGRSGAGRRAIPSTNSASPPAGRSRSRPPGSPSTIPMAPMWRSGCSRPSPSPKSGRAGAATR